MQRSSSSSWSCDHHQHYQQPNSFSMLFTMPPPPPYHYQNDDICPYDSSSSSAASVDCTLSLATPAAATCLTEDYELPEPRSSSRFCWDFLQPENTHLSTSPAANSHRSNRGGGGGGGESLVARRCANCDTTSTPLWRNGPRGPKSLCNACGIRYKKEERRTAATAVAGGGDMTEVAYNHHQSSWIHHKLPPSSCYSPAAAVGSEYNRYRDDVDDRDSTFLSWRLNVTDRPTGLLHDFTRY
ncbi:hypothetical protein OSB04_000391 [Centaurea solstitialis]|uniref:GATA-type domain-containing protein n=1 Tax=Centaurea solstitialis TaxID=347529 RepID=A0AA38WS29_9ASTR|nr:hypothetical protein OSB04_000391 [Centaurea solstitialis]